MYRYSVITDDANLLMLFLTTCFFILIYLSCKLEGCIGRISTCLLQGQRHTHTQIQSMHFPSCTIHNTYIPAMKKWLGLGVNCPGYISYKIREKEGEGNTINLSTVKCTRHCNFNGIICRLPNPQQLGIYAFHKSSNHSFNSKKVLISHRS